MESKKLIIYGAGDFGERLFRFLSEKGVFVDCFCQTTLRSETTIFDAPVLSLNQLKNVSGKKVVLIAIANREISKRIKRQLTSILIDDIEVYECGDFIRANLFPRENKQYCLMCNSYAKEFIETGIEEDIFTQKHIVGGGYREYAVCPYCFSVDRERWVFFVLSKFTDIFSKECSVLHFAPENGLEQRIKNNELCDYYSCDIMPERAMHIVDVTNIQFKDNTFDYIIINHVLEHVIDEKKAISELKRVLKPTGSLIMSFPICRDEKTFEDYSITTKEDRLRFYGQEDHIRLYGYDYKERFENYGLELQVYHPSEVCSETDIERYRFIPEDTLILAKVRGEEQ